MPDRPVSPQRWQNAAAQHSGVLPSRFRPGCAGPGRRAGRRGMVGYLGEVSGFHRAVRNNLPLHGSCRLGHLAAGFTQAQCAKYRGRLSAASMSVLVDFFQVLRSCTYS